MVYNSQKKENENYFLVLKGLFQKTKKASFFFQKIGYSQVSEFFQMIFPLEPNQISDLDIKNLGHGVEGVEDLLKPFLEHNTKDEFWSSSFIDEQALQEIDVPIFHIGGWYDSFQWTTTKMIQLLSSKAPQKLWMGPWAHLIPFSKPTTKGAGDADFGLQAKVEIHSEQKIWFDYWLKGKENGILEKPLIRIFTMGTNCWKDLPSWPPENIEYRNYFLQSDKSAQSRRGDGILQLEVPPEEEKYDRFSYNPKNPVPTIGGRIMSAEWLMGAKNQIPVENRNDVLVYSTPALQTNLQITGQIQVRLFVSCSTPGQQKKKFFFFENVETNTQKISKLKLILDIDLIAKLVEVKNPSGYAQLLAEGVIRGRFRKSLSNPKPMKPHKIYEFLIDLWSISHVFTSGNQIRLEITCSSFPRWDRNTLGSQNFDSAEVKVFHSEKYPSKLILPINS